MEETAQFVLKSWHYWLVVIILFLNLIVSSNIDDNIKELMGKRKRAIQKAKVDSLNGKKDQTQGEEE
jgi:hypothetical protein